MSVRKMKGKGSKRKSCGASVFHSTQLMTNTVIHAMNVHDPIERATRSLRRPKRSVST